MTELAIYGETQAVGVDSWAQMLPAVGDLAGKLSQTDFVPKAMRGSPAAVAAAILMGRELGVGPMTALAHIHVVQGKPGMSAQLMRQLILAAGHQLRYVETTNTRCIVEGRRRGDENWQSVTFTADQARAAKIDLGGYPEDKLVARATSRLARRIFADCLGGVPYLSEELADDSMRAETATLGSSPTRRTARRASAAAAPAVTVERADAPPREPVAQDEPPLDDEPIEAETVEPQAEVEDKGVTRPQLTKMAIGFEECGYADRADRLRAASTIVGRPLTSSQELTRTEASTVIETLAMCQQADDPQARLTEILDSVAQAEGGAE